MNFTSNLLNRACSIDKSRVPVFTKFISNTKELGLLNLVLEFLEGHYVGSLAWVSEDGGPRVATIYYVVDDAMGLVFKSRSGSEHMQCLLQDPRAAMGVYNHDSTYSSKEGVQLKGLVSRVADAAEMGNLVDKYGDKFAGAREKFSPINELVGPNASSTLYRFKITHAKYTSTQHQVAELNYQELQ